MQISARKAEVHSERPIAELLHAVDACTIYWGYRSGSSFGLGVEGDG
jgi:hypothetical protein